MEHHLRLAEKRGLLQGRNLSLLQEHALTLLMYAGTLESQKQTEERIKLALLSAGAAQGVDLFPTWFGVAQEEDESIVVEDGTPEAEAALARADTTEDYSEVDWVTPSENTDDLEELLALQQALMNNQRQTVVDDGDGWI